MIMLAFYLVTSCFVEFIVLVDDPIYGYTIQYTDILIDNPLDEYK